MFTTARPLVPTTCLMCFPKRLLNSLARRAGVTFVPKSKAQTISTVVQYHSSLETVGNL